MAFFYTDIEDFKTYVGGAVNLSMQMDSLHPTIEDTAYTIVRPLIGEALYQQLTADPLTLNASLLPYVLRPLAMLSLYEYTKVGGIQFGEQGLFRIDDEGGRKSAFKYQENDLRESLQRRGYDNLERLLRYLESETAKPADERADWTEDWRESAARARHREPFISYAEDLHQLTDVNITAYAFRALRPALKEARMFSFQSILGNDFYLELVGRYVSDTYYETAAEKERNELLIEKMKPALAHFALRIGLESNWVTYQGNRIVQVEQLEPQSSQRVSTAGTTAVAMKIRHHEEFANRHLKFFCDYLNQHRMDYPTYDRYRYGLDLPKTLSELPEQHREHFKDRYDSFGHLIYHVPTPEERAAVLQRKRRKDRSILRF